MDINRLNSCKIVIGVKTTVYKYIYMTRYLEVMTDLWERNYGMDSMNFFYRKCLECLQYVTELHWNSEWYKGVFEDFRMECVRLSSELETAKRTEVGLKE